MLRALHNSIDDSRDSRANYKMEEKRKKNEQVDKNPRASLEQELCGARETLRR